MIDDPNPGETRAKPPDDNHPAPTCEHPLGCKCAAPTDEVVADDDLLSLLNDIDSNTVRWDAIPQLLPRLSRELRARLAAPPAHQEADDEKVAEIETRLSQSFYSDGASPNQMRSDIRYLLSALKQLTWERDSAKESEEAMLEAGMQQSREFEQALTAARQPVAERERIWRLAYSTACAGSASDYCLGLLQELAELDGVTIIHLRKPLPSGATD